MKADLSLRLFVESYCSEIFFFVFLGIICSAKVPSCLNNVLDCQSGEECVPRHTVSVILHREADEAGLTAVETSVILKVPCVLYHYNQKVLYNSTSLE